MLLLNQNLKVQPLFRNLTYFRSKLIQSRHQTNKSSDVDCAIEGFKYLVPTYIRPQIEFTHGDGVYLFDTKGKKYLDFYSGIAVTSLGHSNKAWASKIKEQVDLLTHVSNLYHTLPAAQLAKRLCHTSFADQVFFCNSGTEANEAAMKFCRKSQESTGKKNIVAFTNGFHGRTLGSLTLTNNEKYQQPFAPLVSGIGYASFNDLESASQVINEYTCGVFIEPIQGESGIVPADPAFLKGLRKLCDKYNALLCFDEVQCGMGRTGYLWAYQNPIYDVKPDILTAAKPMANGLPIGAVMVTAEVGNCLKPGDHGSTFSGGPLVCAAADTVVQQISEPVFLTSVQNVSSYLMGNLRCLQEKHSDIIKEVRGIGLMIGIEMKNSEKIADVISLARDKGLLVITAGINVIRLLPPLVINKKDVDLATSILDNCFEEIMA